MFGKVSLFEWRFVLFTGCAINCFFLSGTRDPKKCGNRRLNWSGNRLIVFRFCKHKSQITFFVWSSRRINIAAFETGVCLVFRILPAHRSENGSRFETRPVPALPASVFENDFPRPTDGWFPRPSRARNVAAITPAPRTPVLLNFFYIGPSPLKLM